MYISACIITIFLILIPVVVASGQRDPNPIDWLDDRESVRTPMGLWLPNRLAIDLPKPNNQTRNRELAEIILGQLITIQTTRNHNTTLYDDLWLPTPFYLNPQKRAELHRIALEAQNAGDLTKLGLDITSTRAPDNIITPDNMRLTIRDRPGPEITAASVNVYLLVIGRATPGDRNRFLSQNPHRAIMYTYRG